MHEFEQMKFRQRKISLFFLGLMLLCFFVTSLKPIFLGLLLGGAVSFFNMSLLQNRVRAFSDAIVHGNTAVSLGFFTRLTTSVVTVLIGLKFPEHIKIGALIIGLMASHIFLFIDMLIFSFKEAKKEDSFHQNKNG